MDNKIAGNKIILVNMDINKVKDTNTPKATVPPKLDAEKIEKPLNKIIDVYTILKPVSLIAAEIANGAVSGSCFSIYSLLQFWLCKGYLRGLILKIGYN